MDVPTVDVRKVDGSWKFFPAVEDGFPSALLDLPETSLPTPEDGTYQSHIRSRDQREYSLAEKTLVSLRPIISDRRIFRFHHCGTQAWFYKHIPTGKVSVFSSACRDRACPVCAGRRSYEVSKQVSEWLKTVHDARFLTLTMRSTSEELGVQVTRLYDCFRRLRRDKRVRKGLKAGIWFFQSTFNLDTRLWHPHLHCIIVGSFIDKAVWKAAWKDVTEGSYILDIQLIKADNACTSRSHCPISKAVKYVARYAARPYRLSDLPESVRQEVVLAFHSRKLFSAWGKKSERPNIRHNRICQGEWERLGSWSYITAMRDYDWRADEIFQKWSTREPLQKLINFRDMDNAVDFTGWTDKIIECDPPPDHGDQVMLF
jgi:hypothetical protein